MSVSMVVHFLHIGKTGGTALVHALNQYRYCVPSPRRTRLGIADLYALNPFDETHPLKVYIHPHDESLREIPLGEKVFFFVRDPIRRFISGFYSRQRQGQPRYYTPWSPDEKSAYERFPTANHLAVTLSSTDSAEKAGAVKAMQSIQHVKNSYWEWFESEAYFKTRLADICFVGCQENLDADFERLKTQFHLPAEMHLPADPVLAHKNPAQVDTTLTAQAVANLRAWYHVDYRFIALCQDLFNLHGLT